MSRADTCRWEQDDEGNWPTQCDQMWCFIVGGVEENGVKFCPYCGGKVEAITYQEDSDEPL